MVFSLAIFWNFERSRFREVVGMWVELGSGKELVDDLVVLVWPFSGIWGGLGSERWFECGWSWVEGG